MKTLVSLCFSYIGISFAYNLSCPDPSHWSTRANLLCPDPSKYFCLWDGNAKAFLENCSKADFTRPGEQIVIHLNFDSKFCSKDFYQPYIHYTNQSSGCIYRKSHCNEEGQVVYDDTDTQQDVKCTCDYSRGFDFITRPKNTCFCIPSEEECSCYLNRCMLLKSNSGDSICPNISKLSHNNCFPINNSSEEDERHMDGNQMYVDIHEGHRTYRISKRVQLEFSVTFTVVIVCVNFVLFLVGICVYSTTHVNDRIGPYVLSPLVDTTCYEGDTCILQCEISRTNIPVVWFKGGEYIDETEKINLTSDGYLQSLTIKHMSEADAGYFELRCKGVALTGARLVYAPVFITGLKSRTCIEGEPVSFECEVSETDVVATWCKENEVIIDNNNINLLKKNRTLSLQFSNPAQSDSGDYSIKVNNARERATLTVKAFIKRHLVDAVIMEGLDVCLSCETERPQIQPQWYKDGEVIQQSDSIKLEQSEGVYKLTIVNVTLEHKGKYRIDMNGYMSEAFLDVKEIPQVLKEMSQHDRDKFMEAAKAGTAPRYYIRVIIVGENGVGKTSLLRRLLNEGIDDVTSTDGINIEIRKCQIKLETGEWTYPGELGRTFNNWTMDEKKADCGFWDFAGQKEYYATHQTFLSSNAVYILAVDLSKNYAIPFPKKIEESEYFEIGEYIQFWLDNIHCFVSDTEMDINMNCEHLNPPVIIVGTGTDKIPEGVLSERINIFTSYLHELLGGELKLKHIRDLLYVSNVSPNNSQFVEIQKLILNLAKEMPRWNDLLPMRWIILENEILNRTENVVPYELVRSLAVECAFPVNELHEELDVFLRYEHEIGNIIFFYSVKEYIILNHRWLVDAFRCLVAPEQVQNRLINSWEVKRSGKLSVGTIKKLFQKVPNLQFLDCISFILKIMEKFDILIKSPFENDDETYYMPCMINTTSFENVCELFGVSKNKCKITSWFCIDFDFLPPAFVNHILVAYVKKYSLAKEGETNPALYRSIGLFDLTDSGCKKIVVCVSSKTIAIQIWDWDPKHKSEYCYSKLRTELLSIVNNIQRRYRISIKYTVNLNCSKGQYYKSSGKNHPAKLMKCPDYFCEEHNESHDSRSVYISWFERCTTCESEPSTYWCYECQFFLCDKCGNNHVDSDIHHHVQHEEDKYRLVYSHQVNVGQIEDIKLVRDGLVCLSSRDIEKLVTVDVTIRKLEYIPVPGYYLWCITVIDNAIVAVTATLKTTMGNKIVLVNIENYEMIKCIDAEKGSHGITCSKNELLTCCLDHTIKIRSLTGKIKCTIPIGFMPLYICRSDNDRVYCTDDNKLYCIDTKGKLLFTFTDPVMDGPRAVTIDDTGHVLVVCNKSRNIIRISPDRAKCEVVVKHLPGLSKSFICNIPQRKLLVVGRYNTIDVMMIEF